MARPGGPALWTGRLALIRLRQRWTFAVAVGIGLAASVAVAGAVSLVQSVASESALQITLHSLGDGRLVDVSHNDIEQEDAFATFQEGATANVSRYLGGRYMPASRYAESRELYAVKLNGTTLPFVSVENSVQLAAYENLREHVTVVSGAWPAQPRAGAAYQVTVSEASARKQGLKPGDAFCLQVINFPTEVICTEVAATWRPRNPDEAFWGFEKTPANFVYLERAQLFEILTQQLIDARAATVHAVFDPDLSKFHARDLPAIQDGFRRLHFQYTVLELNADVATGVDTALDGLVAETSVAQFAIDLVAAQILVVALYYLAFVAGHSLDQQRQLFAVWRSRGWSAAAVWRLVMLEFAVIAVVATPVGLALAWMLAAGVTRAVYGSGSTVPSALLSDQVAPVGAVVAVALAVLAYTAGTAGRRELLQVRRQASRPQTKPWWQWRNLDLVLGLLSIPLLLQVRELGQSVVRAAGLQATDPFSLLLPAVALALIAIAALRLLPLAARGLGLLRRGLDQRLASWQLSRHPVQHARLALLLAMAMALGTFAAAFASTSSRNSADRAAYAVGTDVRATLQDHVDVPKLVGGVQGVDASSAAFRNFGHAGHSIHEAEVLAVDPASFEQVAWSRPDFSTEPMSTLMQRLVDKDPTGLALPGKPTLIGVWASSRAGGSAQLVARISDDAGRTCECELGAIDQPGWHYLQTFIDIPDVRYPLKLRQLELTPIPNANAGEVSLSDLDVAGPGGKHNVVETFDEQNNFSELTPFPTKFNLGRLKAWWFVEGDSGLTGDFLHADDGNARDGRLTTSFAVRAGSGTTVLKPPTTTDPLPALAPASFLADVGVDLGVPFPLNVDTFEVPVAVVGITDHFATLYPEQNQFLVVPEEGFLSQIGYTGFPRAWPNEVWLKTSRAGPVAQQLRDERADVRQVLARPEMETAARTDPMQLGLESNLLIGFFAAMALAVVGFIVHFLVVTRGRLSDYAILQANGMSRDLIRRSLGAERATLLAFAVVAGTAIGLVLAWVLLPSIQLGTDITQLVPPTLVSVDPVVTGGAIAVVVLAALAGGAAGTRLAGRFHLMDELRLLG
jgi:hypothetical protein